MSQSKLRVRYCCSGERCSCYNVYCKHFSRLLSLYNSDPFSPEVKRVLQQQTASAGGPSPMTEPTNAPSTKNIGTVKNYLVLKDINKQCNQILFCQKKNYPKIVTKLIKSPLMNSVCLNMALKYILIL